MHARAFSPLSPVPHTAISPWLSVISSSPHSPSCQSNDADREVSISVPFLHLWLPPRHPQTDNAMQQPPEQDEQQQPTFAVVAATTTTTATAAAAATANAQGSTRVIRKKRHVLPSATATTTMNNVTPPECAMKRSDRRGDGAGDEVRKVVSVGRSTILCEAEGAKENNSTGLPCLFPQDDDHHQRGRDELLGVWGDGRRGPSPSASARSVSGQLDASHAFPASYCVSARSAAAPSHATTDARQPPTVCVKHRPSLSLPSTTSVVAAVVRDDGAAQVEAAPAGGKKLRKAEATGDAEMQHEEFDEDGKKDEEATETQLREGATSAATRMPVRAKPATHPLSDYTAASLIPPCQRAADGAAAEDTASPLAPYSSPRRPSSPITTTSAATTTTTVSTMTTHTQDMGATGPREAMTLVYVLAVPTAPSIQQGGGSSSCSNNNSNNNTSTTLTSESARAVNQRNAFSFSPMPGIAGLASTESVTCMSLAAMLDAGVTLRSCSRSHSTCTSFSGEFERYADVSMLDGNDEDDEDEDDEANAASQSCENRADHAASDGVAEALNVHQQGQLTQATNHYGNEIQSDGTTRATRAAGMKTMKAAGAAARTVGSTSFGSHASATTSAAAGKPAKSTKTPPARPKTVAAPSSHLYTSPITLPLTSHRYLPRNREEEVEMAELHASLAAFVFPPRPSSRLSSSLSSSARSAKARKKKIRQCTSPAPTSLNTLSTPAPIPNSTKETTGMVHEHRAKSAAVSTNSCSSRKTASSKSTRSAPRTKTNAVHH